MLFLVVIIPHITVGLIQDIHSVLGILGVSLSRVLLISLLAKSRDFLRVGFWVLRVILPVLSLILFAINFLTRCSMTDFTFVFLNELKSAVRLKQCVFLGVRIGYFTDDGLYNLYGATLHLLDSLEFGDYLSGFEHLSGLLLHNR